MPNGPGPSSDPQAEPPLPEAIVHILPKDRNRPMADPFMLRQSLAERTGSNEGYAHPLIQTADPGKGFGEKPRYAAGCLVLVNNAVDNNMHVIIAPKNQSIAR